MKVVLKEDVEKLGRKGEIKEVKEGFARNYLFKRNLAELATPKIIEKVKKEEKIKAEKEREAKLRAEKSAKVFEKKKITLPVKTGASGKLYGSIQDSDITKAVETQIGVTIDPKMIEIPEPIKEVGVYKIKIVLHKDVKVNLDLKVIAQS
jgi:large subunit ribosomal protein L9